ncbi:MAG: ComEC/Rec2 family competence protein [Lentisphaerae bacterium]|nr:ComEC/Rec2 family competence protein [Lentisphaerota bacterium]
MTHRIVTLATAFIIGIVLATGTGVEVPSWVLLGAATTGAAISIYLYWKEKGWREYRRPVIALAALLCGLPLGYWRTMQMLNTSSPGSLGQILESVEHRAPIAFDGTISKEPEIRGARQADLQLRVRRLRIGHQGKWIHVRPQDVLLRTYVVKSSSDTIVQEFKRLTHPDAYGYHVEVYTSHERLVDPANPGEFNMRRFLSQKDVVGRFRAYAARVTVREETRGNPIMELALAAKKSFLLTYKATMISPPSRLAAAATLGMRRAVEKVTFRGKDIAEMFRHAGVGHVLAVSGLHVSIVSVLLYSLLRLTGLRPRAFVPALILSLILFALLTGSRPSSVRAVIMNSVILIAHAYFQQGLRQATFMGLALSSLMILLSNPLLLFAPSFVLSFGAVLSLVVLSPPVNRWLGMLRGFSLIFFALWFALLLFTASVRIRYLLNPLMCLGFVGSLWFAVMAGGWLNSMFPRFWGFGVDRLPPTLRMFLAAQLSIQAGMMIPLSAWFFGRLPVAGVLVNLLAIPAIGVLVQMAMLTGVVGLIPVVGTYAALPFGAATTVIGEFFYWLAHLGSEMFPFPAVPKPTVRWMLLYYAALVVLLFLERAQPRFQSVVYKIWPTLRGKKAVLLSVRAVPILLCLVPLLTLVPAKQRVAGLTCLSAGSHPLVILVSEKREALIVNAGNKFSGGRMLFDAVREHGATQVDTAIVAGAAPGLGSEGLASLAAKMPVRKCFLPVAPADPARYLEELGDDYLVRKAAEGDRWAVQHAEAYTHLVDALAKHGADVKPHALFGAIDWENAHIRLLPPPSRLPGRYISRAKTAIVEMQIGATTWVIVSDSTPETLDDVLGRRQGPCHVLVLPGLVRRPQYESLMDRAVRHTRPSVVIVCGKYPMADFDIEEWAKEKGTFTLLVTGRDGAIRAEPLENGAVLLRAYGNGRVAYVRGEETRR